MPQILADHEPERNQTTVSEILDPTVVKHLTDGFATPIVSSLVIASLPYHQLGGAGLERLCYSLLSATGKIPRYFGIPGQAQFGIDLIVSDGGNCTVYQCKNVKSFGAQDLSKVLQHLEDRWLARPHLPRPAEFVLCCPLPLAELKTNEAWTSVQQDFYNRTGVTTQLWDKDFLDARLKRLPDIVADLFSARVAEFFCKLDDWNEDLFRSLIPGSGELKLNRYLEKKAAGQIYVDVALSEKFAQTLKSHGSLLIQGLPGSGKTTTALALAESVGPEAYRVFYINMRRDLSEDVLVRGIRRRLTRPTIFLLDDCHGKYEILEGVQDRLLGITTDQPRGALLVYTARTTPTPKDIPRADYSSFVEDFRKAGAVLEFVPTHELFMNIVSVTRPELTLSQEQLDRIFTVSGRDLFLLDQLLETIKSADEIDRTKPADLFEGTLLRYFGQPTVYRPGFMLLTALAQFDIAPSVADFPYDLRQEDPKATTELLVGADRPVRYFFLHSSAAELIFRALAWSSGISNHAELAALKVAEYFLRSANDPQLPTDFSSVFRNRLKLLSDEKEDYLLKTRFLGDERIYALIDEVFERLSLNTVTFILIVLKDRDPVMLERYRELVDRKVSDGTALKILLVNSSAQFLTFIKREYPSWYSSLQTQFANHGLRQLIEKVGFRSLLRTLASFGGQRDFILDSALDSLSDDQLDGVIERTIDSRLSISNVGWELRELKSTNPSLLEIFERKMSAARYIRLIVATGTVLELFKIVEHSSLPMVEDLIRTLNDEGLDNLIDETISRNRSIGTIHFTLRDLKDANPVILEKLEQRIGARNYLRLIKSAGTIFELFRLIQYSSLRMAAQVIETLDDKTLDILIKRTVATDRSIGTLSLTLWELKRNDPEQLKKLEQRISAERYLYLITGTGTFIELFNIIEHSSRGMAAQLIQTLNDQNVNDLVEKTLAAGRPLGSLAFCLKQLRLSSPEDLNTLQRKIGVERWWNLILANGKMNALSYLIRGMDISFRKKMMKWSEKLSTEDWKRLFLRGNLGDLTLFTRFDESYFLQMYTPDYLESMTPVLESLIHTADWPTLRQSSYRLSQSPNSPFKDHVHSLLTEYLAAIDMASLRFRTFGDAVDCIETLWREFPSKRDSLAASISNILPSENRWYREPNFLASATRLLFILATGESHAEIESQVLTACNKRTVVDILLKAESREVLFFLWNLYSLWFKTEKLPNEQSKAIFKSFVQPEFRVMANRVLQRFQFVNDQSEQEGLLSLFGFLIAGDLSDLNDEDKQAWLAKLSSSSELLNKIETTESFISAAFFLIGLKTLFGKGLDIPTSTISSLMSKVNSYDVQTAALKNLRQLLKTRFRLRHNQF